MKRISKKNRYLRDLIWQKDHFETELKRVKPWSETGKFSWIYYLGDQFTISQAKERIKQLTTEIELIQSDPSYTPWKDNFDFEKHIIEDIKRNLDEQEIPEESTSNWAPESGSGVCKSCEEEGKWLDPAGGIHTDDEEDPAAMYE